MIKNILAKKTKAKDQVKITSSTLKNNNYELPERKLSNYYQMQPSIRPLFFRDKFTTWQEVQKSH